MTALPLPLQLTQAVELTNDPEATFKELLNAEATHYNPLTQVRETAEGTPMIYAGGGNNLSISIQLSTILAIIVQDNDNQYDD